MQFIENFKKLKEFGFPADHIVGALILHDNVAELAIESCIASGGGGLEAGGFQVQNV
jgi:hypothetical protein